MAEQMFSVRARFRKTARALQNRKIAWADPVVSFLIPENLVARRYEYSHFQAFLPNALSAQTQVIQVYKYNTKS
jgi:hypothetical protein